MEKMYTNMSREVLIIRTTPLEQMEVAKKVAIRNILSIVDNNCSGEAHAFIRAAVLDNINEMFRSNAEVLDRIIDKFNGG